jgi:glycosyltransferase involved in cell wall biosynthesis
MAFDVSVIMPAWRAGGTIARAVASVLNQERVAAEVVLCADDDLDYWALLPAELRAGDRVAMCRTPAPRSGPSAARNIALAQARGAVVAALDADDVYAPGRLARLLPAVERLGVATGPTREIDAGFGAVRIARPRRDVSELPLADICELRMPFSPVFQRALCPLGWPQIDFAEDVILNVDLACAAGAYAFVDGADYEYHLSNGSRSHARDALERARTGYLQILQLVAERSWPQPVRELVARVFSEDLANVERALASSGAETSWREAVRDGAARGLPDR